MVNIYCDHCEKGTIYKYFLRFHYLADNLPLIHLLLFVNKIVKIVNWNLLQGTAWGHIYTNDVYNIL